MKEKMILFDLDGTLWDSSENVAISWNIAIHKSGFAMRDLTGADIRSVMGKTLDEISEILFPGVEAGLRSELIDNCQRFENEYIAEHGGVLFEGVRETLMHLRSQGYPLAIVSNCQTGYIPAFLKSMNMQEFFVDYEEWGNTMMPKAYNIRLVMDRHGISDAVYIGDTSKDMEAADGAGIPFIFARYGFGDIGEPRPNIDSFSSLPEVIGKL